MLTIPLQFDGREPLYQQIYRYIRHAIEMGSIDTDEKLPSKRKLSAHLKVSISTVETAYAQLKAEGYIYSKEKSGFHAAAVRMGNYVTVSGSSARPLVEEPKSPGFLYDFRTDRVDPDVFPFSVWAKLTRVVLSKEKSSLLDSVSPKGLYELRVNIADHLRQFRGMDVVPEQIIVGAGWEYLLTLIIQLLGRDCCFGVEDPGYQKVPKILESMGCTVRYLPMDCEGIRLGVPNLADVDVLHVTPSHHFPLGTIVSASRRRDLLHWAEAGNRYLIEDDYDSEFRYEGRPIPALWEMDRSGCVIYIKTFAKSLAPSLRIAYMILPLPLLEEYEKRLLFYASTVSSIDQQVLSRFIGGGYLERHLNRSRILYKKRRDIFIDTVVKSPLGDQIEILGREAGMHLLLRAKNMAEQELIDRALKHGISLNGLSQYYHCPDSTPQNTVIAGYAGWQEEPLRQGVTALMEAWQGPLSQPQIEEHHYAKVQHR